MKFVSNILPFLFLATPILAAPASNSPPVVIQLGFRSDPAFDLDNLASIPANSNFSQLCKGDKGSTPLSELYPPLESGGLLIHALLPANVPGASCNSCFVAKNNGGNRIFFKVIGPSNDGEAIVGQTFLDSLSGGKEAQAQITLVPASFCESPNNAAVIELIKLFGSAGFPDTPPTVTITSIVPVTTDED